MKYRIYVIVFVLNLCFMCIGKSEPDTRIVDYLKRQFDVTRLENLIFLEEELIEFCKDSIAQVKFIKEMNRQKKAMMMGDQFENKERRVLLTILRNRIANLSRKASNDQTSIKFLLDQLEFSRVNFEIDESLLKNRLNFENRGLPYGDEACDVEFSYYTFFIYDSDLYIKTLANSKVDNTKSKIFFPVACVLEEESGVPVYVKQKIKKGLLEIIRTKSNGNLYYRNIEEQIEKANLNAERN